MKRSLAAVAAALVGAVSLGASGAPTKTTASPSGSTSASASAAGSASTGAQPSGPKSLSETLTGEAKTDFDEGFILYKNGDCASALVKLRRAHELSNDARLLWNMASCEKQLRHYAETTRLLRRYLEEGGALVTDVDREHAKQVMESIEPFTAGLAFAVSEPGAEVTIDEATIGATPLPGAWLVDIGARKIAVKKPGFTAWTTTLFVDGSKREVPVAVTLAREVHEGKITVRAPAGAEIFIDGKHLALGEGAITLPSGGHTLRVVKEGMRVYQTELAIADHDDRVIDVPLEPVVVEEEKYDRWEAGLRGAWGKMTGNDRPAIDLVEAEIGVRLGRPTSFGLALDYGNIDASNGTCGRRMDGPVPTSAFDLTKRFSFESCHFTRARFELLVHFLPRTVVDPWLGFDVGALFTWGKARSFDPLTASSDSVTGLGLVALAGAQLGIDVHPLSSTPRWSVGPYAAFAFSVIGQYGLNGSHQANGSGEDPNESKHNGDAHPFTHFLFGLRTAISF